MSDWFRVYFDEHEIGSDGYPYQWHSGAVIKNLIRERDGHRCLRCGHPYEKGMGEWSRCDELCHHAGPSRVMTTEGWRPFESTGGSAYGAAVEALKMFENGTVEAQWRILTVHHLNGVKHDCRWWNLVSLCQRCHLTIQAKVRLERPWALEHSDWFKPFVAAYYANAFLDLEPTPEEVEENLEYYLNLQPHTKRLL